MGDKEDNKSKISTSDMDNLSLDINGHSRDLLTRFMGWREGKDEVYNKEDDDEEKIELNLGLSLGGQFGVDKCSNKLLRASSIAECLPFVKDVDDALTVSSPSVSYSRLSRTTSLPIETEEWRKRKELQTLRRMEAKRRRSEKQRNLRVEKEGVPSSEKDLNLRNRLEKDKLLAAAIQIDSRVVVVPPPPPLGSSTSAIKGQLGVGGVANKGKKIHEFGHLLSQKSVEYQGGSSSSSEFDNRFSLQGSRSCEDASQSLQESNNKNNSSSGMKSMFKTSLLKAENLQKHSDTVRNQLKRKEALTIASEEMPGVFTKGDGPNGRRVDGILYKFGRGEEVRIMCVCHGSFHSPAGFVKHAGGTDISHPLKHIVMNPNLIPLT